MATIAPIESRRSAATVSRRGPRTNKEQRRQSTERLLQAALGRFISHGYQATTVEDVARDAELTKGAVYFYFGSKAQLLMALLDRVEALTIEPTIAAVRAVEGPARDRLVAFMHSQSTIGAERGPLMMLAILMATELHGSDDAIADRIAELMERLAGLVRGIVERGQVEGSFRADLGARELTSLLMAINQGCFVEWYRRGRDLDGPEFVRAMRTIVLDGVGSGTG